MTAAVDFYHERLLAHPDAGRARQYLRSRGYDGEVVRKFRLGYAPAAFDELVRALRLPGAVLREAGLAYENERTRLQDAFRERIMFPIFDPGGQAIAFGGRVLPDSLRTSEHEPGPKYRNSPESAIYSKRRTLYGLNWAKSRHRPRPRGRRLRGLHRRHRLPPRRRATRRSRPVARRSPRITSACSHTSPTRSCCASTLTPPGRPPQRVSTSGRGATSSNSLSPSCRWDRTRASSHSAIPASLAAAVERRPAVPRLPRRAGSRRARPAHAGGPQPGGRICPRRHRRASERARPRPVPRWRGRPNSRRSQTPP